MYIIFLLHIYIFIYFNYILRPDSKPTSALAISNGAVIPTSHDNREAVGAALGAAVEHPGGSQSLQACQFHCPGLGCIQVGYIDIMKRVLYLNITIYILIIFYRN